jgi:hypothetical protein
MQTVILTKAQVHLGAIRFFWVMETMSRSTVGHTSENSGTEGQHNMVAKKEKTLTGSVDNGE